MTTDDAPAPWPEAWQQKCESCGKTSEDVRRRIPCGGRALCPGCFRDER